MRFLTLLLIAFTFISASAFAADEKTMEVEVKVKAQAQYSLPTNLELPDHRGKTRSFEDMTGENGLVIVFFRSAEWCPYCQVQLLELQMNKERFDELGYNLVGVSYDNLHVLDLFYTRKNLDFPLLGDPKSKTIRAFGILNEEHKEGSFAYGVPHPTIYIVDKNKQVLKTLSEEGYKKRPEIDDIIAAIPTD